MSSVNQEPNGAEHMAFNATNKALLSDKFSATLQICRRARRYAYTRILMKFAFIALFSVFLLGCVSTHMKQYLGKDIREVVLDSGPPVNAIDMEGGVRAFQFMWGGGTYRVP